MQTYIQKWGNSLGVRIPSTFSHQLNLKSGSLVNVEVENHHLVIFPQKYCLQDMLDNITEENSHTQVFRENPKGLEEW